LVSSNTRLRIESNALSFTAVSQRLSVEPVLWLVISAMTCCQVRVGNGGVGRGEVGVGDLQVDGGLFVRLFLGVPQAMRGVFVFCLQAFLPFGFGVLNVKNTAGSLE
jgi:hypothetical protein